MTKSTIAERQPLTQALLKAVMTYDPSTGIFRWAVDRHRVRAGDAAGSKCANGYLYICIDQRQYLAHRLAFLYVDEAFPPEDVDHRDGDRENNRYANLRQCSRGENMQNVTNHDLHGVTFRADSTRRRRWSAAINAGKKHYYLGCFHTAEEARAAYLAAKAKLHPFQPTPRDAAG